MEKSIFNPHRRFNLLSSLDILLKRFQMLFLQFQQLFHESHTQVSLEEVPHSAPYSFQITYETIFHKKPIINIEIFSSEVNWNFYCHYFCSIVAIVLSKRFITNARVKDVSNLWAFEFIDKFISENCCGKR